MQNPWTSKALVPVADLIIWAVSEPMFSDLMLAHETLKDWLKEAWVSKQGHVLQGQGLYALRMRQKHSLHSPYGIELLE